MSLTRVQLAVGGLGVLILGLASGCAEEPDDTRPAEVAPTTAVTTDHESTQPPNAEPADTAPAVESADPPTAGAGDGIRIDVDAAGTPIDPRLFGTNLPAWLGPERLAGEAIRGAAVESGTTLIRMPGGSWSNHYNWLGCELRDESTCGSPWAARPSDFIAFLQATGTEGSWTINVNESAQSAAAAVAFFNGSPDDQRPIGTDRNGVDWQTVGDWAQLRVEGGNPQPAAIEFWEIGNEVYAAGPSSAGEECTEWGWEYAWTCDGGLYVTGNDSFDGYLDFRQVMTDVDPDIQIGAVGVSDPSSWRDFGHKVIDAAGEDLDVYTIHEYGFDEAQDGPTTIHRAARMWPDVIARTRAALPPGVPLAVTEYNLISGEGGDLALTMTQAMNALFLAETLGQLAIAEVPIANQWNLANLTTSAGTDYGLVNGDDGTPFPQFEALANWTKTGSTLLTPVTDGDLHVYPTRHDDGRLTVILVNLDQASATREVEVVGSGRDDAPAELHSVWTDDLSATRLDRLPPQPLEMNSGRLNLEVPGWSISRLEIG